VSGCEWLVGSRVAAVAALSAALILSLVLAREADAARTGPAGKAFYEPPEKLPKGHGKLIWKRGAGREVRLAGAAYTRRILYTSKSPQKERIAVSGSISVPKGRPPKRGWPVISYAHGTTGVADVCAPSRAGPGNFATSYTTYAYPVLEDWVRAGYALVRTDYQGLGTPGPHPYLIGRSEARGILDIVRAARDFKPSIGKRFLIAGHSQGGQAALFGARYAERWTPELRHRGTASYAPASHLLERAGSLPILTSPSPLSGLVATIIYGAATADPRVVPEQTLRSEPFTLFPRLERVCTPQLGNVMNFGRFAPADMLRADQPNAAASRVLGKMNPAVETDQPIFLAQGGADSTALPIFTDLLDAELRDLGARVEYRVYEGVNHGGILEAAGSDALPWMERRLPTG
jgi:pimeloyl-ACP methyl ester carboxylesterase